MEHLNNKTSRTAILSLILSALLTGCSTLSVAEKPTIHAAYTLFAPSQSGDPLIYARTVIDGVNADCPTLSSEQESIPTTPRHNPDSNHFPVTVCEAIIPFNRTLTILGTNIKFAAVKRSPVNILVIGDSGCKKKDCPKGESAQPFGQLAIDAAKQPADLILHMGDYNYRGTQGSLKFKGKKHPIYDAGDNSPTDSQCELEGPYYSQNALGSSKADHWQKWRDDFFRPAEPLLMSAPWVFARGNHELCSRAGPGWFYFLGPGSNLNGAAMPQLSCPDQGDLAKPDRNVLSHLKFVEPYQLKLTGLQLLVLDSANACDGYDPQETTTLYTEQLDQLAAMSTNQTISWLVTHRPFWGIKNKGKQAVNVTLQKALANSKNTALPSAVKLVLSGHKHLFQSLTFPGQRPPQLLVGNSGVALTSHATEGSFKDHIDDQLAFIDTIVQFGYLTISYKSDGSWHGVLRDDKKKLATCISSNVPGSICQAEP